MSCPVSRTPLAAAGPATAPAPAGGTGGEGAQLLPAGVPTAPGAATGPTSFAAFAAEIAADPRFDAVAAQLCREVLGFFAGQPAAMRLMPDQGRMRVAVACRLLHPDITVAAVQRLVPPVIASPGRVAAAIQLLGAQGFLVPSPVGDRRAHHHAMAPGMEAILDAFLELMVRQGLPFARSGIAPRRPRDWAEEFLLATLEGGASIGSGPGVERGHTLRGGALLNLELMRRGLEREVSPFSRRAFAARFGLSRTHVIDLLAELAGRGWLAPGREFRPSEAGLAAGRAWLSRFLAISAAVLDMRFRSLAAASRAEARAARAGTA